MTHGFRWLRWLPWDFFIQKMARAHGFLDPVLLLSQLQRFTQPSEVNEPVELLRAGAVLHARGLINSRVIQHNLDWVWPYWVEQQFDPCSDAFIPRAFSITHINLTHRNWTAVGLPDYADLPIVDPRGLLTPFIDRWSLDVWLMNANGEFLLPSRMSNCKQRLHYKRGLSLSTLNQLDDATLETMVMVEYEQGVPMCYLDMTAIVEQPGYLAVVLRPYNPEGISFIHTINVSGDRCQWIVNNSETIVFDRPIEKQQLSDYRKGDVYSLLKREKRLGDQSFPFPFSHQCDIGLLTAAALFSLTTSQGNHFRVKIPLSDSTIAAAKGTAIRPGISANQLWQQKLHTTCQLKIPNKKMQFLYDSALRTLLLHTVDAVYPGPYTYKRFWYRDATFIIYALLCAGLTARAERALDYFPSQQTHKGYFHSQEGEWDSNGQVLWIFSLFCQFTGKPMKVKWQSAVNKGIDWLVDKRLSDNELPHGGLLPAGFSAEHLGPNDDYYWDDFWAIAGLREVSLLDKKQGKEQRAKANQYEADLFQKAVDRSVASVKKRLGLSVLPASPYRRLDAGAIGSLVAGYPLQLYPAKDVALLATTEFLLKSCMFGDGFFQDMIHSGINPYLTLHIAQILLRAEDSRFFKLVTHVADLASPTGQWPEAVHPKTGGGCMGDGQHSWAAAEWILMMRHCFVREESDRLVLGAGIQTQWWRTGEALCFGPAPTRFGVISLHIQKFDEYTPYKQSSMGSSRQKVKVSWQGHWHGQAPMIDICLPACDAVSVSAKQLTTTVSVNGDE
ncbi:hypothetical protein AB835_03350 [Candidatus Endobugula sertula]|uniref:Uncharacterized protein n=1 Tax=Candidatus Endobugula sertula TaxID=62101 RepID=A0A1D2QSC7_9GAMM|nr:hypothetical protein AB835_03350 [Candidatus Endobugula sertula]